MSYTGRVKEGVVVFEGPERPPEGAAVRIVVLPQAAQELPSWGEVFKGLIGTIDGMPEDLAENHDHYIHGAPRR